MDVVRGAKWLRPFPAPLLLERAAMPDSDSNETNAALEMDPVSARRIRDASELLERERNARRQLDEEKTVRERLLAMMTTELVTQANVARGWLDLMRRERLTGSARDAAFERIDSALNAQLVLLDELIGLSPAAAGRVPVDCRPSDVAAIVRAVAADVGDERVRVSASDGAVVVADVEHLVRAIRSLISATTRDAHFVEVSVGVSGDSVHVRFSGALPADASASSIARRVAQLYGGAIAVADNETVFVLPVAPGG